MTTNVTATIMFELLNNPKAPNVSVVEVPVSVELDIEMIVKNTLTNVDSDVDSVRRSVKTKSAMKLISRNRICYWEKPRIEYQITNF